MPEYTFTINGQTRTVDAPEWLPMLWVLRDKLGINGPKYGCGIGACRACTSHLDGEAFNPCVTPVAECDGREVTTIEGLADGDQLHPVQQAWLEVDVAQCGFCQPGQIMTAVDLIRRTGGEVTDDDIDTMDNVCRCGTYARIRQAVKRAAEMMNGRPPRPGPPDPPPGHGGTPPGQDRSPGNGQGQGGGASANGGASVSGDGASVNGGASVDGNDVEVGEDGDSGGGLLGRLGSGLSR